VKSARAPRLLAAPLIGVIGSLGLAAAGAPAASTPAAAQAPQTGWQPGPERYGMGQVLNLQVAGAGGTTLRVDVYFPSDIATGQPAPGPFPVLMVQTPYGKTGGQYNAQYGSQMAATEIGPLPYLVKRGYIDVVADVRGSGASAGDFGFFDPIQAQDGVALVKWVAGLPNGVAGLPHANGKVGLYGPSYMGINQFLTVNALGPNSPVKAIFPIVAGNDIYRDTVMMGGIPDAEFSLVYLALTGALNSANPLFENYNDPVGSLQLVAAHGQGVAKFQAQLGLNVLSGGDQAYDETYWQTRTPRNWMSSVVAIGVPAFMVGGWYDLFQRGTPLNYSALQNAYAGRPVGAAMPAGQPASGRYQLLMGPWYHLTAGDGLGEGFFQLQLAWFDHWLKDADTGIERTASPLHLYAIGLDKYVDASTYPIDHLTPSTFYLGGPGGSGAPSLNDGSLSTTKPTAPAGADQVLFLPAQSPCGRQMEQWGAGAATLAIQTSTAPPDPCTTDDRSLQVGPGALTYTTAPVADDTMIGGPINASIFLTSTRPDTLLEATIEDVGPGGASVPLTTGAMAGSFRALDAGQTWTAPDGKPMLPYHPYTKASLASVPLGSVVREDIEVYPTFARLARGHSMRLTINTSDMPHLLPLHQQAVDMAGGVYQVQRTAAAASFVEVPMGRASDFPASTLVGLPGNTYPPSAAAAPAGLPTSAAGGSVVVPGTGIAILFGLALGLIRRRARLR
jgi:putative CocE/NonD family hydrolase